MLIGHAHLSKGIYRFPSEQVQIGHVGKVMFIVQPVHWLQKTIIYRYLLCTSSFYVLYLYRVKTDKVLRNQKPLISLRKIQKIWSLFLNKFFTKLTSRTILYTQLHTFFSFPPVHTFECIEPIIKEKNTNW